MLELRAARAIEEYRLLSSGAATWRDLGYGDPVPGLMLRRFLAVDAEVQAALREKAKE